MVGYNLDVVPMNDAPNAWQIQQALAAWSSARSMILSNDEDIAEDEAVLTGLLGPDGGDVRSILSRLLTATQFATSMADGAETMSDNLKRREARYRARSASFRATIFAILDALGERSMEFPHGTLSIANGRVAAVITDESALPDRFVRTVTTRIPDRVAIARALKDGEVIEGATLSNSLPVLTIRGK